MSIYAKLCINDVDTFKYDEFVYDLFKYHKNKYIVLKSNNSIDFNNKLCVVELYTTDDAIIDDNSIIYDSTKINMQNNDFINILKNASLFISKRSLALKKLNEIKVDFNL